MAATLPFFERIRMKGTPAAHPDSVVVCGQARFTVLTPRLIRLEWATDGLFEDRGTFAFPNRTTDAAPPFTHQATAAGVSITTEYLVLRYSDDGKPFHAGNLVIELSVNGQDVQWTPGTPSTGNLRGTARTLDQVADATFLQEGLLSRDGWTLFDDSNSVIWDTEQVWVEGRRDEHRQDWYFFGYGQDYRAQLSEYIRFGGAIPLVPRYVLGGWWSRFWAYHAEDLKQLVRDFDAHDVPLDVLVVDMDWHTPDGWTGYTWNRELFPDPEAFLKWVHDQHLQVTLNLHPADGIQKHEAAYPEFAKRMGIDPATGEGVAFRGTDKTFIQQYFELLHHPMEEQGIDFWWLDWQQGESSEIKNLDPLPWLNHLHHRDSARRGIRPMLYSRWGGLGNHRYPIGFSGDTYTTWASLQFQPYFTATAANVGYGWWSHDIGGHFGAADPELYTRWVQYGAVSPCLRLHSTKDPLAERRPWGFSDAVYKASQAAFQFRYRLLPYLYSAAWSASQDGVSLCYPMYYDYPTSDDAYLARSQYFLGNQLIAVPLVSPTDKATGLAAVDAWIPEGTWFEYTTLEAYTGSRWTRLHGDLNRIPLLAKAGAIIPLAPAIKRTAEFDGSYVILALFPGADGQFELYEDDNNSEAYQAGAYETTSITFKPQAKTLTLNIAAAAGHCDGLPATRTFELRFKLATQPVSVTLNGAAHTDWHYDAEARECVVFVRDASRTSALDVAVTLTDAIVITPVTDAQPFMHAVDYVVFDDARHQFGTLIVDAPASAAYDAEVIWTLETANGVIKTESITLNNCQTRQLLNSPFKDDGQGTPLRWKVSARVNWQGQTFTYDYASQTAYPALNRWQTVIYNPDKHAIQDFVTPQGTLAPQLNWLDMRQLPNKTYNVRHPYGLVLLEHERERIIKGEALEACVTTSITRTTAENAVLHVQSVGDAKCYLNGVELTAVEPLAHEALQPMFYSWIPPKHAYYALPLKAGDNRLVIITRPNTENHWWGIGASMYNAAGDLLL